MRPGRRVVVTDPVSMMRVFAGITTLAEASEGFADFLALDKGLGAQREREGREGGPAGRGHRLTGRGGVPVTDIISE